MNDLLQFVRRLSWPWSLAGLLGLITLLIVVVQFGMGQYLTHHGVVALHVYDMAFRPQQPVLTIASKRGIELYNVETKTNSLLLENTASQRYTALAWSSDGVHLAVIIERLVGKDDSQALFAVYDTTHSTWSSAISIPNQGNNQLVFSPDDHYVAIKANVRVLVWNMTTQTAVQLPEEVYFQVAFLSDNRLMNSYLHEIWRPTGIANSTPIELPVEDDTATAVTTRGNILAQGYMRGQVHIWQVEPSGATLRATFFSHPGAVAPLILSADNRFVVTGTGMGIEGGRYQEAEYAVRLWRFDDKRQIAAYRAPGMRETKRIAISSDGIWLAALAADDRWIEAAYVEGTLYLWKIPDR